METKVIARINDMDIISSSDEQYIPIRPICTALGIDPKSQMNKIKRDPILSSVSVMMTSTGADGKRYEMLAIPYFLVFGWIYSIDDARVSPESVERVRAAKIACMKALYYHIVAPKRFLLDKQKEMEAATVEFEACQEDFIESKERLNAAKNRLNKAKNYTMKEWEADNRQLKLFSEEQKTPIP